MTPVQVLSANLTFWQRKVAGLHAHLSALDPAPSYGAAAIAMRYADACYEALATAVELRDYPDESA